MTPEIRRLLDEMRAEADRRTLHGNPLKWSEADGIRWAVRHLEAALLVNDHVGHWEDEGGAVLPPLEDDGGDRLIVLSDHYRHHPQVGELVQLFEAQIVALMYRRAVVPPLEDTKL